ncbi:sigma 54-dependent Fis family transcriptional regulator [Persicimonas caeni]|uniref:Sigma 54-dependent Fis family transcriptional regulator n=1 Tax=Persicimonas caeni TaxID=2292766 RepID=A0A4Y6PN18_PERCE|nr:sigma 54-interacting transcriptional regulator [Persicimonas caeni]QDG49701.1 sigma 54-dependent Fis family transcriptional regulator [Persicimonas caeni]QED30922.1 sigma 54-dependent Fis family transcriptional regulator [Persicimonas caeni]
MAKGDMGIRTVFVNDRATSRQLRKGRLVVLEGADEGKSFEISKSKVYAGRASVNDILLKDKSISSTHFEIRAEEEGFLLRDCGSTNGTKLGGCRIREVYLTPNATFRAGNTTLKLEPVDEVVEIPLSPDEHFQGVIGRSVAMREVFATLEKVAPSELTCLIEGQTGTGKERIARAIHDASRRRKKPYVVLDCSAIPRDLMESYVFGHEKGAFTGAHEKRAGAFEQAEGGTLFLDEIGELDLSLQPKLLRVLENREFKRVGGARTIRSDCRVVAATNKDLRQMVNEGTFREDLYFRLSVIQLHLPPLSERREDIPLLVEHFLDEVAERRPDRQRVRLTAEARDALMAHPWPGNVRELKNVIVRAASLCSGSTVERSDLQLTGQKPMASAPARQMSAGDDEDSASLHVDLTLEYKEAKERLLDQFEYAYLDRIYEKNDGNISKSARESGITRYHMRELLKKHELK